MVFQASASSLGARGVSELFLNRGQLLKSERGVLIGRERFGGAFKIALGSQQVAARGLEVASNQLVARSSGQRFKFGEDLLGIFRFSLKRQNPHAFAQNARTVDAAVRLAHPREWVGQKSRKRFELSEFGLRIGGEHGLCQADLKL